MSFFFNDTATTEIYTLSLHDALPIFVLDALDEAGVRLRVLVGALGLHQLAGEGVDVEMALAWAVDAVGPVQASVEPLRRRSEEHTSELQSRQYLVCRLLLEKKKEVAK